MTGNGDRYLYRDRVVLAVVGPMGREGRALNMEQIDGSETSAFKNQTPGIHPKDYSQYSKHGESLKSRIL
jgi:hypothetical protein